MTTDGALLISGRGKPDPEKTVEVVRSFAFKLNLGGYQSADFFASQKQVCKATDADEISADLYDWCYDQVMTSVKDVQAKQARKQAAMAERNVA